MTLLAIDPGRSFKGEKTIGVSVFREWYPQRWKEVERLSLSYTELRSRLVVFLAPGQLFFEGGSGPASLKEVVIEDYVNNSRSKGGQRNGTSECIGMVEDRCYLTGVKFIRQEPAALAPAKLHAPKGSFKELKHLRHEDSAFLHGYEYLVRQGRISVDLSATM